jgi:hypothetical protein
MEVQVRQVLLEVVVEVGHVTHVVVEVVLLVLHVDLILALTIVGNVMIHAIEHAKHVTVQAVDNKRKK